MSFRMTPVTEVSSVEIPGGRLQVVKMRHEWEEMGSIKVGSFYHLSHFRNGLKIPTTIIIPASNWDWFKEFVATIV